MVDTLIHNLPTIVVAYATEGQTTFTFPFRIFRAQDAIVSVNGKASNDYVVSYDSAFEGGAITFIGGLARGSIVIISRALIVDRSTKFPNTGPVSMASVNREFDRVVSLIQDVHGRIDRVPLLPIGELGALLPSLGVRSGTVAGWGADGSLIPLATTAEFQAALLNTKAAQNNQGLASAVLTQDAAAGSVARSVEDILRETATLTPKGFGAVETNYLDGPIVDSSAAFQKSINAMISSFQFGQNVPGSSSWLNSQRAIMLPPGRYRAGGLVANCGNQAGNIYIRPIIPGTVSISIPDGVDFLTINGVPANVDVEGINFVGGRHVFVFTNAGNNVAGIMRFAYNKFDNYSGCAIGNLANDAPYLRAYGNFFMGKSSSASIGIAWGGYGDCAHISGNAFLRNRYHLKIGDRLSGNILINGSNDFIMWDQLTPYAAAIWIVPQDYKLELGSGGVTGYGTNAGQGTIISENKFGNENLTGSPPRVLIAREQTGGGLTRLTAPHSTAWDAGGNGGAFVSGITITANRMAQTLAYAGPMVRSHINEIRTMHIHNNKVDGGGFTYAIEFVGGTRTVDYSNLNSVIEVRLTDGISIFSKGVSNQPIGMVIDPAGITSSYEETVLVSTAGDDTSFVLLGKANSPGEFTTYSGADLSSVVANYEGRNTAREMLVPADDTGLYLSLAAHPANKQAWIEFDIARGLTNSLERVYLDIFNFTNFVYAKQIEIPLPPAGDNSWRRVRLHFKTIAAAATASWQLRIAGKAVSGTSNRVRLGRVYVHLGRQPMHDGHLRTMGSGLWDGEHIALGNAWRLWVDDTGRLRIKNGAPTSATDGTVVGAQT